MAPRSNWRGSCINSGAWISAKPSSGCCGRARTSNGFSLVLRRSSASASGDIDIILHLPVQVERVPGVFHALQSESVRAESEALPIAEDTKPLVKLAQGQIGIPLLQGRIDLRKRQPLQSILRLL